MSSLSQREAAHLAFTGLSSQQTQLLRKKLYDLIAFAVSDQRAGLHVHTHGDPVLRIVCEIIRRVVASAAVLRPELSAAFVGYLLTDLASVHHRYQRQCAGECHYGDYLFHIVVGL